MNEDLFNQLKELRSALFSAQQRLPHGFKSTESEIEDDLKNLIRKVTREMEIVRDADE